MCREVQSQMSDTAGMQRSYLHIVTAIFGSFLLACGNQVPPDEDSDLHDSGIDSSQDAASDGRVDSDIGDEEDAAVDSGEDTAVDSGEDADVDLSEDAEVPLCDRLADSVLTWIDTHQDCDDRRPCHRLGLPELPQNYDPFCHRFAAPGEDLPALEALTADWLAEGCGDSDSMCGGLGGLAICQEGRCRWQSPDCEVCDFSELDPQCTTAGWNALNPCVVEHCFLQEIDHAGWCEDSPECVAMGGYCEETARERPFCPDGFFYTFNDTTGTSIACATGSYRNTCCIPWEKDCTYYGGSWQAETNPFTCDVERVCMNMGFPEDCHGEALISSHPLVDPWDASISVTLLPDNQVTLEGTSDEFSRTFECTGPISHEFAFPTTWECESCSLAGGECRSCSVLTGGSCSL